MLSAINTNKNNGTQSSCIFETEWIKNNSCDPKLARYYYIFGHIVKHAHNQYMLLYIRQVSYININLKALQCPKPSE